MIESGSSIGVFMTCPKKYFFSYEKKLETFNYYSALGYGSFVHGFIETLSGKGRPDAADQELFRLLAKHKNPEDQDQIRADYDLAKKVTKLWHDVWCNESHPFGNPHFDWQHSEFEWKYTLPLVANKELQEPFFHVGKSDGVVLHKKYGKVFLYELKTAADRSRDSYVHHLQVDKQISSNIIALRSKGIEVAGVIYDVIWKPALIRAKNRKTKPDENITEFHERIFEKMRETKEDYFERHIVFRNDKDIVDYSMDLRNQYEAIETAKSKDGFYRNSGACDDFGRLCQYFSVCMEGKEEMEGVFNVRDRKLPELSKEVQNGN